MRAAWLALLGALLAACGHRDRGARPGSVVVEPRPVEHEGVWPAVKLLPDDVVAVGPTRLEGDIVGPLAEWTMHQTVTPTPGTESLVLVLPSARGVQLREVVVEQGEARARVFWGEKEKRSARVESRATTATVLFANGVATGIVLTGLGDDAPIVVRTRMHQRVSRRGTHRTVRVPTALGPFRLDGGVVYPELDDRAVDVEVRLSAEGATASLRMGPLSVRDGDTIEITGSTREAVDLSWKVPAAGPEARMFVSPDRSFALVLTGVGRPETPRDVAIIGGGSGYAKAVAADFESRFDDADQIVFGGDLRRANRLPGGPLSWQYACSGDCFDAPLREAAMARRPTVARRMVVVAEWEYDAPEAYGRLRQALEARGQPVRIDVVWTSPQPRPWATRVARAGGGTVIQLRDYATVREAVDGLFEPGPDTLHVEAIDWGGPVRLAQAVGPFAVQPDQQVVLWGTLGPGTPAPRLQGRRGGQAVDEAVEVIEVDDLDLLAGGVLWKQGQRWRTLERSDQERFGPAPLVGSDLRVSTSVLRVEGLPVARPVEPPKPERPVGTCRGVFGGTCMLEAVPTPIPRRSGQSLAYSLLDPRHDWVFRKEPRATIDWGGLTIDDAAKDAFYDAVTSCYASTLQWHSLDVAAFELALTFDDGHIVGVEVVPEQVPYAGAEICIERALEELEGASGVSGRKQMDVVVWMDAGPRSPLAPPLP